MKFKLTSPFGELSEVRNGHPHSGIDLAMPEDTILRSIDKGIVEKVIYNGEKIGNGIIIRLEDGTKAIYGHLNKITVEKGQDLYAGQQIGLSGSTGRSTGPHLHFALQKPDGSFIDPTPLGEKVAAMSGEINGSSILFDKLNDFSDFVIGKEVEWIFKPLLDGFKWTAINLGEWIIINLPDIVGYTAVGAGIIVILSTMLGKGILKPLGWFFGVFIIATCILGGANT